MFNVPVKSRKDLFPLRLAGRAKQGGAVIFRGSMKAANLVAGMIAVVMLLDGCTAFDRLINIGEQPKLSAIDDPTTKAGYKPVQMPMPTPQPAVYNPNSLWRNGSRAFFKDQRAQQVGDLLTVTVNITDTAQFANETQLNRTGSINEDINNFFGKPKVLGTTLPGTPLNADGSTTND